MPHRQHAFADPLPIATPRTLLRRLTVADLRDFQAYRTDPEVARYQGWTTSSDAAAALFLEQNASAPLFAAGIWFQLGIALTTDGEPGRLIGDIGIGIDADDPTRAEIGFSMNGSYQGRGLAAEAVAAARTLAITHGGVRRLAGITDARNTASIRLLARLGFRLESTRAAVFRDEPCFEHHYLWEEAPDA
jgi:RimJ/RimL family protein N-acetyltransferase